MKNELVIGRVRTAFGTAGEIKVESFSGETEHFLRLTSVELRRGATIRVFSVESARRAHKTVLMKLAGIDTPEKAAALRDSEIVVSRAEAAPLRQGEYYYADLQGLAVRCGDGEVGRIGAIWESGEYPLLEVVLAAGGSVLVPFVDGFFGEVDLANGTIELRQAEVLE